MRESKTQSLARSRIWPVNAAPVTTELRVSVFLLQLPDAVGKLAVPAPAQAVSLPYVLVRCGHCLGSLAAQSHMLTCCGWVQASRHRAGGVYSEGCSKMAESGSLSFF